MAKNRWALCFMMTDRTALRRLMAEKDTVITVGVGDAISAKLASGYTVPHQGGPSPEPPE